MVSVRVVSWPRSVPEPVCLGNPSLPFPHRLPSPPLLHGSPLSLPSSERQRIAGKGKRVHWCRTQPSPAQPRRSPLKQPSNPNPQVDMLRSTHVLITLTVGWNGPQGKLVCHIWLARNDSRLDARLTRLDSLFLQLATEYLTPPSFKNDQHCSYQQVWEVSMSA